MPNYAYRGRDARGGLVSGRLEGVDSGAVADQLLAIGVTPVDIEPVGETGAIKAPEWWRRLSAPTISDVDVMLFSRQMYALLKAGVPIMRALAGLQQSTRNTSLAEVIADLRTSLDSGRELSAAMRSHPKVFSPFYLSVIRIGEATGELDQSFNRMFGYMEFDKEIRDRIKAAVRYPIIVVVVIAVAVAVVNFFVIPAFAKIFAAQKVPLPLLTQVLIGTSNFFLAYWWAMLGALAAAIFGAQIYIATEQGRYQWDRWKLRLPLAGPIILKATLARFARGMSLAVRAGVPIVQAMSVVAEVVSNSYMSLRINQMRDGVERGESVLRTAVASGIFTPVVLEMVSVGEETGDLDDLMDEVGDMYEREVDYEIRNLAANIEPILTVALGVMVLILALGVFLPIWGLGNVLLKK
ncbi:MAG: type II secretion system F family protein [Betaproteobacteria bacterium]|nr:type II secretion system F family protein [Betaproteobacteria bacterium]